jgi:hypothetical protein
MSDQYGVPAHSGQPQQQQQAQLPTFNPAFIAEQGAGNYQQQLLIQQQQQQQQQSPHSYQHERQDSASSFGRSRSSSTTSKNPITAGLELFKDLRSRKTNKGAHFWFIRICTGKTRQID